MFDFLKLRQSVEGLGKRLKQVRSQIETTRREIETIVYGPSHPDDIVAAAKTWLESKERRYQEFFAEHIFLEFTARPGRFEDEEGMARDLQYKVISGDAKDFVFIGMLGSKRVLEIFKEHAAKIPANEHGLRNAERAPVIQELQLKLDKLVAEEAELVAGAAAAGLAV